MKASELVYMILDLAKANTSDDAYYTEDHILFLCKKFRAQPLCGYRTDSCGAIVTRGPPTV